MKTSKVIASAVFLSMMAISVNAQVKKAAPAANKTIKITAAKAAPAKGKAPVAVKEKVNDVPNASSIRVRITTDSGTMVIKLYDSTPLHRDNFVKLVKEGFYDSLMFHRVIPGFMIQGGDPSSKNAAAGMQLGMGGGDMQRIPAEFRTSMIHKKGALAAARDGNPQKASSACQFYIVQGKPISEPELNMYESNKQIKYTADQKEIYKTIGGTPMLDQDYTVFGEMESGMEVIDKIANVAKDGANRPLGDIRMHMEIIE